MTEKIRRPAGTMRLRETNHRKPATKRWYRDGRTRDAVREARGAFDHAFYGTGRVLEAE